jgi:hypothetical protein
VRLAIVDPKRQSSSMRSETPSNQRLLVLLAPYAWTIVIIGAATSYADGRIMRLVEIAKYGIPDGLIAESFQATIARGFVTVAFVMLMVSAVVTTAYLVRVTIRLKTERRNLERAARFSLTFQSLKFMTIQIMWLFVLIVLLGSVVAAIYAGEGYYKRNRLKIEAGCLEGCTIYSVHDQDIVGVPVAGDQSLLLIAVAEGGRLLKVSEISATRPAVGWHLPAKAPVKSSAAAQGPALPPYGRRRL